jgi:uncharacterized membrane protein YdbT with pleckstrin-like domain
MNYVHKVLLPGELVVYQTGLHWLVYGRAILLTVLAVAFAIAAAVLSQSTTAGAPVIMALGLAALFALLAGLAFLTAAIRRATTELAVTDQRVLFKHGVFSRHTVEMNRSKVESVDVDQSLLGRIFGYGTVMLRGTGGSLEPMAAIADPLTFRSHITADPVRQAASASSAS